MASSSSEKRCLYEVLGLPRDCTPDAIRTAYKKLALQRHPDKLVQSGVPEAEATAQFQELVHAYEVLSDPKERQWYDNHRSQILFSNANDTTNGPSGVPNLYSYFSNSCWSGYDSESKKGFYRVYGEVFDRVYRNEVAFVKKMGLVGVVVKEAPLMGDLKSDYEQVVAFYNYWLGFMTVMDFCWVDQYDVMAGVNRKSRRVMDEENRKLRKKARREYNETVRGLAEFVKKRDKRVVDMMVKREEERARKREEERERRKREEKERAERARRYEEPEWAKVDEEEVVEGWEEEEEEREGGKKKGEEFYCVACGKKFKSEKQWKNHEQSKKHKEKVAELRESFADEDEAYQDAIEEEKGIDANDGNLDGENGGVVDDDDEVDELGQKFEESVVVEEADEENVDQVNGSSDDEDEDESYFDPDRVIGAGGFGDLSRLNEEDEGDDETSVLEAMVSGHKKKNGVGRQKVKEPIEKVHVNNNDDDDSEFMEYNNRKGPKNRRARKDRGKKNGGVDMKSGENRSSTIDEGTSSSSNLHTEESASYSIKEDETIRKEDDQLMDSHKTSNQATDKKGVSKKEANAKLKKSSKGKKAKASSKNSTNLCEKCGEEFESRNKLHKHLNETGHASLKYR